MDTQSGVVGTSHPEQYHAGVPYSERASVDEFWPTYGDSYAGAALLFAANEDEFRMNSRYFVLRLNFIVRGISKDEAECVFGVVTDPD